MGDMFVGFEAKFLAVLRSAFPSQQSDRPSRDREDNALYHPGYGLQERGTHQGWIRSKRWFVKAEKYPVFTTIAIICVGAILWSVASSITQTYQLFVDL